MENVKKQVKRLTYTTKSLEEKAKNIDRCNREGDYDTDRPWEELILGLLELRKQVDALLALHGWKEMDGTKPKPCTRFRDAGTVEWIAKLMEETNEVVQEAVILEENADEDGTVDHDKYGLVDVKKRLSMELTDVIHVCISWLDAEGWDEEARGELHRRVNEKNKARGYLEE